MRDDRVFILFALRMLYPFFLRGPLSIVDTLEKKTASVFSQECRVSVRAAHHLPISWPTEFLQGILTFQDMKSANKRRPPYYWHTQKVFSSSAIFQQIFNQFSIRFLLSDVKKAICLYLLSNQLMHSFSPTTGHSVLAAKLYIPNLRLIYFSSIQKILRRSIFIAI